MKWEIWVSDDGRAISLVRQGEPLYNALIQGPVGQKMTKIETFEAESSERAKVFYEGWLETYDCRN